MRVIYDGVQPAPVGQLMQVGDFTIGGRSGSGVLLRAAAVGFLSGWLVQMRGVKNYVMYGAVAAAFELLWETSFRNPVG